MIDSSCKTGLVDSFREVVYVVVKVVVEASEILNLVEYFRTWNLFRWVIGGDYIGIG